MSEEIKDIILDVKDSLNETPKNMYKYNKITLNLNEFEEILNYIEQLENIKKEAIEYINHATIGADSSPIEDSWLYNLYETRYILSKGDNNE